MRERVIRHWIAPYLDEVLRISRDPTCGYTLDYSDAWCSIGSEAVADFLNSEGVAASLYAASWGEREWGGVRIDPSHEWVVLDKDGTILDVTICQFIDSPRAHPDQRRIASGYPYVVGYPEIAVVPADDLFVKKMGYESHLTGGGWAFRPKWWGKTGRRFRGGPL